MGKLSLRTWARSKRKELDMAAISAVLAEKLVQTEAYKKSKNIMIFYPMKDEVNLLAVLKDSSKNFYLPRVNGQDMECCLYKSGDELRESAFHTMEPVCAPCGKTEIDLVVAPALACDKNGYRLGYGGGFYDRFLEDFRGIKVCCIPEELVLDTVYPNERDIKMDLILDSK